MTDWCIDQARKLYNINHWGKPYFDINEKGNICVKPRQNRSIKIDLAQAAEEISKTNLNWPVLVRITDILHDRVDTLCNAFADAMQKNEYNSVYTSVYPIKVNQQRTVVEHILETENQPVGLEAGSKPELMVVLSHSNACGGVIVCNGYKDREYIRLALIGQKLGHKVYIVVEKLSELSIILEESKNLRIPPLLGIRIRLSSIGKGNWQNTGGEKSKFGLSASQVLQVIKILEKQNATDSLKLIHCHLGSQLANIRDIQKGLQEVARYYAELRSLGAPIDQVDVGGGLGVDYEGTRSRSYCSMNYSIEEYANDVVYALSQICKQTGDPQPNIITESGRALTAHHAMLITNIIDTESNNDNNAIEEPDKSAPHIIHSLWETLNTLSHRSVLEAYHDAVHWLAEAQSMYTHGVLSLLHRAEAERIYFRICHKVRPLLSPQLRSHREIIDELNEKLADKYFCNLSIFQSLPDIWAIDQIFPITPLQRMDEEPVNRVTLQDLTCDSDGAIDHYVSGESIESTLPAHNIREDEKYLIGIFLVGAYQEILGDMHNLLGDTHSIDLELADNDKGYQLVDPEKGDMINEILHYVHYNSEDLLENYSRKIQNCKLTIEEQELFFTELQNGLTGYSYLED